MATNHGPLAGSFPSLHIQPSLEPSLTIDTTSLNIDESKKSSPQCSPDDLGQILNFSNVQYPKDIEANSICNQEGQQEEYRIYKRRWVGLAVLTLQSLAIGWGFTAAGVVTGTATAWYGVTFQQINDLSIVECLAFIVAAPFVIWVLNRAGPKRGIMLSCLLTVVGNWVIYAGVRTHNFPVNIAGVAIRGLGAPFALCAPTRYSRQWFGDNGRTLATAIPSLAYPLGAGVGALTAPYMVMPPLNYSIQSLVIACVFTAVALPASFLPTAPPTPPSAVAAEKKLPARESLGLLFRNRSFYLQLVTFMVVAGAIDAASSVTFQAIKPYGYKQYESANAIALLIFVGIGTALVVSPILDRIQKHEIFLKIAVVIIAIAYTCLPWIPESHSVAALYITYAVIGACSLSLEPAMLEYQASQTRPVSPEFSSVISWCCCKISTAIFTLLVGNVLVAHEAEDGQPRDSLFNGLLFVAGLAWLGVVCSMFNGVWIFKRRDIPQVVGND